MISHGYFGFLHVGVCRDNGGFFYCWREISSDQKTWQFWKFTRRRWRSEITALGALIEEVIKCCKKRELDTERAKRHAVDISKHLKKEVESMNRTRRIDPESVDGAEDFERDCRMYWSMDE